MLYFNSTNGLLLLIYTIERCAKCYRGDAYEHDGCPSVLSHPGKEAGYQDVLPYPD